MDSEQLVGLAEPFSMIGRATTGANDEAVSPGVTDLA